MFAISSYIFLFEVRTLSSWLWITEDCSIIQFRITETSTRLERVFGELIEFKFELSVLDSLDAEQKYNVMNDNVPWVGIPLRQQKVH